MIRGSCYRVLHNPLPSDAARMFARSKALGMNTVALVTHHYCHVPHGTDDFSPPPAAFRVPWYIWPDVGQDPDHPFTNTPNIDLVYQLALEAEAQGLTVILKPHLDSYNAEWRGHISVRDHARDFRYAYRERFLRRYIQVAKLLRNPILCFGTELVTVTRELGVPFWADMVTWIRSRYGGAYNGPLTYAANWGRNLDAEHFLLRPLWPSLDYVGIDEYSPKVAEDSPPSPDYATLLAGWDAQFHPEWGLPSATEFHLETAHLAGRPLLLTEVGVGNFTEAAKTPWADPPPASAPDDQLQADYARSLRARLDHEPAYAGFCWWEATTEDHSHVVSHSVTGKPAELAVWAPAP